MPDRQRATLVSVLETGVEKGWNISGIFPETFHGKLIKLNWGTLES